MKQSSILLHRKEKEYEEIQHEVKTNQFPLFY